MMKEEKCCRFPSADRTRKTVQGHWWNRELPRNTYWNY